MEGQSLTEVKIIIKSLIISSRKEITVEKLNHDYKLMEGYNIPYQRFGYDTLENFLYAMPDTLTIFGKGITAKLRSVTTPKSAHIEEFVQNQIKHAEPRVNKKNNSKEQNVQPKTSKKNSFFKTINKNQMTRTLKVRNAPPSPKTATNTEESKVRINQKNIAENELEELGVLLDTKCEIKNNGDNDTHKTISENCLTLSTPDAIKQQNVESARKYDPMSQQSNERQTISSEPNKLNGGLTTYSVYCDLLGIEDENFLDGEKENVSDGCSGSRQSVFNFDDINSDVIKDLSKPIPNCCLTFPKFLTFGEEIPPNMLFLNVDVDSRIEIIITEIHSFHKFYFHTLRDSHELDTLMHNIEKKYEKLNANEWRIPFDSLTPGRVCAASYRNLWHRAIIVEYPVKNKVMVDFVDYGTVYKVDVAKIKYLSSDFCELPVQALHGSLSNVKPLNLKWNNEANIYFANLVTETIVYAKISEIDAKQRIFHLIICVVNHGDIVEINNALMSKRFATHNA